MSTSLLRLAKASENERADSLRTSTRCFSAQARETSPAWQNALLLEIDEQLRHHVFSWLAVQRSISRQDYRIALYERLGSGRSSWEWIRDLHAFLEHPADGTFFAVFPDSPLSSYEEFERAFERELGFLFLGDAGDQARFTFPSRASRTQVRVSFEAGAVAMLGLHPDHPHACRRFSVPAIVISRRDLFI